MIYVSTPQLLSATTTTGIDWPAARVSGLGTVVYVITSGITGSWTFLFDYVAPDGTVFNICTVTGAIATNVATNAVLNGWTLATATPLPNRVTATKTGGTVATMQILVTQQ